MIKTEYIIKKSKFYGFCIPLNDKADVKKIINQYKKEHKKAAHVVHAYLILNNGCETAGFSDDGEPKNTAGRPIYDLLRMKQVYNVLIIIVRYFGGVKLGAGGLIRAYRESAKITIDQYLDNI
ncbi:YigZ family protein [Mycoplasma sp. NEAQ87857]|uniref:IMPACT family protein n=1 Tax=Mycoplasma sp. NEAQ87857 TaxID=2683967 RepID=UPI001318A0AF|nr:YigZ family protein [Mycoplasma sp. NEAQ87857]QGZ97322.1 YigZ family protein [Mycoplasma sp. NEAQ87857]